MAYSMEALIDTVEVAGMALSQMATRCHQPLLKRPKCLERPQYHTEQAVQTTAHHKGRSHKEPKPDPSCGMHLLTTKPSIAVPLSIRDDSLQTSMLETVA